LLPADSAHRHNSLVMLLPETINKWDTCNSRISINEYTRAGTSRWNKCKDQNVLRVLSTELTIETFFLTSGMTPRRQAPQLVPCTTHTQNHWIRSMQGNRKCISTGSTSGGASSPTFNEAG
jgi:hypothetical protein